MDLPSAVAASFETLSATLPLDRAMACLKPAEPCDAAIRKVATQAARDLNPVLQAAIALYVDDLDRAHSIIQVLNTEEAAYWHGVMHRREGDFSNAKYWFRRAGSLPNRLGLDPIGLTDRIEKVSRGPDPEDLVQLQRAEWSALFEHCAKGAA